MPRTKTINRPHAPISSVTVVRCLVQGKPTQEFTRFTSQNEAKKFASKLGKLSISIERVIDLDSFKPSVDNPDVPKKVYGWFDKNRWKNMCIRHLCYPDLVREFYFRAKPNLEDASNHRIDSWVRGTAVSLTPASIRSLYSLPYVEQIAYPYVDEDCPSMDKVVSELVGAPHTWDHLTRFPVGLLTADYRVLHRIIHHCLIQSSHATQVTSDLALQLYAIGVGDALDMGEELFQEVSQCSKILQKGKRKNPKLLLGSLITRFLIKAKVPLYEGEKSESNTLGSYNLTSWIQSKGQTSLYQPAQEGEEDAFLQMKEAALRGKPKAKPRKKRQFEDITEEGLAAPSETPKQKKHRETEEFRTEMKSMLQDIVRRLHAIESHLGIPARPAAALPAPVPSRAHNRSGSSSSTDASSSDASESDL